MAVDRTNGEMYLRTSSTRVSVFRFDADGGAAPLRTLDFADTLVGGIALDPSRQGTRR